MRVSDDRYNRDRLRFDLALRMLRYGARIHTICQWTGLSRDRLRKLYRAYLLRPAESVAPRVFHKAPHHPSCFLRTSSMSFDATTQACLFYIIGLVRSDGEPVRYLANPIRLSLAEAFCAAYEAYRTLHSKARLSFEHSWFLLEALAARKEIKLNVCGRCKRCYLTDTARLDFAHCGCSTYRLALPRRRQRLPHTSIGLAFSNQQPAAPKGAPLQQAVLSE